MEYHVLASGSKGNSIFIYDQGNGLLIDCGISKRQLYTKLNQLRFHESDIHHVLLTHDHIDHNKNIGIFDQSIVYCGKGCIPGIDESHELENYQNIQLDHYIITPLPLSHDATSPLGFVIKGKDETILYMTDTGYVSQKNMEYSAHVMAQVIGENTKEICLAHLSQEANTKEMALGTYQRVFDEEHIYFDNIKIADQKEIVSGGHYEN